MRVARQPIHERVKAHVAAAKLTHSDLAKKTGWSEQRVYRVLNGKTDLSAEDMEKLARVLKTPVAELFTTPEAAAS